MRIELRPSALLFLLLMTLSSRALLGWKQAIWAGPLIVLSVFAHELGHVAVARAFHIPVKLVGLSVKGGYNVRQRAPRRWIEALIILAGPAVNLGVAGVMVVAIFVLPAKASLWVALANLVLVAANLLPVGPSDGKRLWRLATQPQAVPAPQLERRLDKAA